MNKNVKKIVALALAIGTVSAVAPATNVNLLTTRAYASTDDDNTEDTLDSLKLETSSGSSIKLYSDDDYDSDNKVDNDDVTDDSTYYAKTSSSTLDISTSGPNSKYVRVFKGTSSSTKGKKTSSDISLSSGTTTITVKVYSQEPSSSVEYGDDDDVVSEYKVKVKYTGSDSSDNSDSSDDYDEIYLDKLSVEGESITLSKSKTDYTYSVASDVDEVTIKAVPEDTDYTVTIDGNEVNEDDDKFKDDVSINKGENEIRVKIENDDNEERVYTLKVTRGSTATATTAATTATAQTTADAGVVVTAAKPNQWVQINGGWQYNDSMGNPIKNQWFLDRNLGKWYYLGADGMMASNTTIGGYKVGADGAWIK